MKKRLVLIGIIVVIGTQTTFANDGLFFDTTAGMTIEAVRNHSSLPGWLDFYEEQDDRLMFTVRNRHGSVTNVLVAVFEDGRLRFVVDEFQFPEANATADAYTELKDRFDSDESMTLVEEDAETDGDTGDPAEIQSTGDGMRLGLAGGPRDVITLVYEQPSRDRTVTVDWVERERLALTYRPMR